MEVTTLVSGNLRVIKNEDGFDWKVALRAPV